MLCSVADAQQVVVKDKPGEGKWTVSFSRRHAPKVFQLQTHCSTLAEAKAEAQSLVAWSNSMDPDSDWRLAVIEIEGEDTKPKKPDSDEKPDSDKKPDADKKPGPDKTPLDDLIELYHRIKEFEKHPLGSTQEMNKLVDQYNRQVNELQAVPLGYKPMPHFKAPAPKDKEAAIDLAGAWNTERTMTSKTIGVRKYVGTMNLRRSGAGYEGEWTQTSTNGSGREYQVVQNVTVSVTGNNVTIEGRNPKIVRGSIQHYYADTMVMTIQSPTSLAGRDSDTNGQRGSSRMYR